MKTRIAEQVEEILRGVTTPEDIAEIEKVIAEAKGKVVLEPTKGFWEEKTPCWEMTHCPEMIRNECPAFTYQTLPCWKMEGTYCQQLDDYGATVDDTSICQVCRVYKKYGAGEPIDLEPVGIGIDARVKSVEKLAEERIEHASAQAAKKQKTDTWRFAPIFPYGDKYCDARAFYRWVE